MRVYLDHNSTTPLRPEAGELLQRLLAEGLGNASSLHARGRRARHVVDEARERIAAALGVQEPELVFTSGGTEANNIALQGAATALATTGRERGGVHIVTARTEHSSVLEPTSFLAAHGFDVRMLEVDREGFPLIDPLLEALDGAQEGEPWLVSLSAANNEVGTAPDLPGLITRMRTHARGPLVVHADAVQALGKLPFRPAEIGLDLASFSGHKLGAPVGVGWLWARRGTPLHALQFGGGQEQSLRPGTENAPSIGAAGLACELAVDEQEQTARNTRALLTFLWGEITTQLDSVQLVGPALESPNRLPNTLAMLVPEGDGKVLVTRLDLEGLELSAGSACASGSLEASHVLLAMGYEERDARAGLRLSLGATTTRADCEHVLEVFPKVFRCRAFDETSPRLRG
jgi:cysteine desulfurase